MGRGISIIYPEFIFDYAILSNCAKKAEASQYSRYALLLLHFTLYYVLLRSVARTVHTRENCDGPAPILLDFRSKKVKYRFLRAKFGFWILTVQLGTSRYKNLARARGT